MNNPHRLAALCLAGLLALTLEAQPAAAQGRDDQKSSAQSQTPKSQNARSQAQKAQSSTGSNPSRRGKSESARATASKSQTRQPIRVAAANSGARKAVPAEAVKALRIPSAPVAFDEPPAGATEVSLASQALRSGCLNPGQDLRAALQSAAIRDETLVNQVAAQAPDLLDSGSAGCVPFTLSLGSNQRVTSFSVLNTDAQGRAHRLVSFERRGPGGEFEVQSQPLPDFLQSHRKVDIALEQILSDRGRALAGTLPASLERQVHYLARAFQDRHQLSPASLVRVVYEDSAAPAAESAGSSNTTESGKARLLGMRFFDREQVLDFGSAVWIDRDDLPGGFFTTGGVDAERMFWSSPIDHVKISRGVGSFKYTRTVRQTTRQGDRNVKVARRVSGWSHHQGVDFAAPTGTPVHAVADGKVLMAAFYGGYGNLIILEHAGGYTTYYAHLSAYAQGIEVGALVRRGDEIGAVGSTGRSTGPHLHFELRRNNVYIDPLAPGRNLDLWTLRDQDQRELARRSVVMTAITDPTRTQRQDRQTAPSEGLSVSRSTPFIQTEADLHGPADVSPALPVGDVPAAPFVQPAGWGAPIVNRTTPE